MRVNTVKARLLAGEVTVGTWLSIESPLSAEVLANSGFDWLVVDMEHGPVTAAQTAAMLTAIRTTATIPLVRVLWNENALIQQVLDLGAYGLVVPMVNTRAEAEAVVAAAKYPPLGARSRGGSRNRLAFGTDAATYGRRANDETLLLVQIETKQAVDNVDQILSVPGIDGFFLGPNDLSDSLGLWPMNLDHTPPVFDEAITHVIQVSRAMNKIAGIMVASVAHANRFVGEGFRFISMGSDAALLESAARAAASGVTRL